MTSGDTASERLLRTLAEQLKLPLLQIARSAELAEAQEPRTLEDIAYTADMAIRLIDGFLLSTHLQDQMSLALEPVSLSSLMHDVAVRLEPMARQYHQDIELSLGGKYQPVMAHKGALEAAFTSLGYAMIEASGNQEKHGTVVLGVHRSKEGIRAGVFGGTDELTSEMFKRAKALSGKSRQPLPAMNGGTGAGVFVADALLSSIATGLSVAHHHKRSGFAATFLPSRQLQLI